MPYDLPDKRRDEDEWYPPSLTKREKEVLALVAGGLTNMEISGLLFISRSTVKNHLSHLFFKLDARSRAHLVTQAFRSELLV